MFKIRLERKNETVDTASCRDLRRCEQCGNVVTDPLVTQCPRCWAKLPGATCGSCHGCSMGKS
jgi:rubrerythrin